MKKGLFITFEGSEGCGKTTQSSLLVKQLRSFYDVVYTREPGGSNISEQVRDILLNKENICMDGYTELFLYLASRRQHTMEVIKPALNNNKIVICDRFIDASIAYQGYGRNIPIDMIEKFNLIATDNLLPDLTFVFDIDVELGLEKSRQIDKKHSKIGEVDRIESENVDFHNKVRNGYKGLVDRYPERVSLIKVNSSIEEINLKILHIIKEDASTKQFDWKIIEVINKLINSVDASL